jgi:hypothetical protein
VRREGVHEGGRKEDGEISKRGWTRGERKRDMDWGRRRVGVGEERGLVQRGEAEGKTG